MQFLKLTALLAVFGASFVAANPFELVERDCLIVCRAFRETAEAPSEGLIARCRGCPPP
jgi:hypothetical protein